MVRAQKLGIGVVALGLLAGGALVARKVSAGEEGKLVEIKLKLPKAQIIGTPKNLPPSIEVPPEKPRQSFLAPAGSANLALKRPVRSSDPEPIMGRLDQITDGDKDGTEGSWTEVGVGPQWVQIDLGQSSQIHAVLVWHLHGRHVAIKDVVVRVSDDPDFIDEAKIIFNNDLDNSLGLGVGKDREYLESYQGRLMPAKDVKGRYVRLHSNGSTDGDVNYYTEVEVYGIPSK